ncbi:hypothetical protein HDV62DRAFT_286987 [Trichoderma sp. SZMC 28011]
MWLAATRPMRGRGAAGWLAVLLPLWAVCLPCFARQLDQGCQMTWPFASLPANKGRFALHIIAPGLTLQRGYSQMREVHFKRAFIFSFGRERPPRVT